MDFDNEIPIKPQNPQNFIDYKNIGLVCYSNSIKNELECEQRSYPLRNNSKKELNEEDIINENLCEEQILEALETFVNKHCCYSRKPLKSLELKNLNSSNCFRYVLQSFTETRTTSYAFEPYNPYTLTNLKIYEPDNPWAVDVYPKEYFLDDIVKVEIPNTSFIEDCPSCSGIGSKTCEACRGNSKRLCWVCKGSGYSNFGIESRSYENIKSGYNEGFNHGFSGNRKSHYQLQSIRNQYYNHRNFHNNNSLNYPIDHIYCLNCNGSGSLNCNNCNGGEINCRVCNATGKLRWFIQLQVSFEIFEDEFLENNSELSDDLLLTCRSKKIIHDEKKRVKPIKDNYYFRFNRVSKYFINSHLSKYSHTRILAQRQLVYLIPVVSGTLTNERSKFYIYGTNHDVYYPKYPGKLKCTIL